jgi:hypothetical protein
VLLCVFVVKKQKDDNILTSDCHSVLCFPMFKCGVNSLRDLKNRMAKPLQKGNGGLKYILLMLLFITLSLSLSAQVNQDLFKPDSLYLGTRFVLKLSADKDLMGIIAPDSLTRFAIIDTQQVKAIGKKTGLKLTIVALDTGTHTFPSLIVIPAKFGSAQMQSQPFTLTVNEIRPPKDTTLVDIAGTQKLKGELPIWAYRVLTIILILALLIGVFFILRRFLKKKVKDIISPPSTADNRSNWKKALDALFELKKEQLPEEGQFIAFHYRLSEIMKLCLEAEFRFSANEMTTREIRHYIKKQDFLNLRDQKAITDWLEGCDRVKFAKLETTPEDSYDRLNWFADWLKEKSENHTTGQLKGEAVD